jgi:hypothetical protein
MGTTSVAGECNCSTGQAGGAHGGKCPAYTVPMINGESCWEPWPGAVAYNQLESPYKLRARPDVARNIRSGNVQGRMMARSFDQGGGIRGDDLLHFLEKSRLKIERLRIQGPEISDEMINLWYVDLLAQISLIEIGVTRLLGIPCEFGQYNTRLSLQFPSVHAAILPLTGPYRNAS